ncbi:hypothetical protein HBI13_024900 [Parastagonospora nodorum]|nr:hypothetical protein HBI10_041450 [Parastagonospora nodorum]KAH4030788.1 hypothetical protein HBI13_024900 [Parastagonospora nodorum]
MARGFGRIVSIVLLILPSVSSEYTNFFWPNATTQTCPGMKYSCVAPAICALSEPMEVYYCCVPGNKDEVCHTSSPACDGGGSGKPSGAQISCSSGSNAFCCFRDSQRCTQSFNQVNVCWATEKNPVARLDDTLLNATYKSLRAARPSAASYSIALLALQTMTSTTATPSARRTPASEILPSSTSPARDPSAGSLSGGAIGGIVGGVVGGIAVIGAVVFFLWRRRNKSGVVKEYHSSPMHERHEGTGYRPDVAEMHTTRMPPTEKYASTGYVPEMPANEMPVEMSADSAR